MRLSGAGGTDPVKSLVAPDSDQSDQSGRGGCGCHADEPERTDHESDESDNTAAPLCVDARRVVQPDLDQPASDVNRAFDEHELPDVAFRDELESADNVQREPFLRNLEFERHEFDLLLHRDQRNRTLGSVDGVDVFRHDHVARSELHSGVANGADFHSVDADGSVHGVEWRRLERPGTGRDQQRTTEHELADHAVVRQSVQRDAMLALVTGLMQL